MSEVWTKWESLVINGIYPLRRFLSRSNHSVVFLTDATGDYPNAAIKLIPADPTLAEARLARWRIVIALSHPHLLRLLDAGRCQLGGHQFLFVVMEHAEQTLAQLLPQRALTPDEMKEMLPPTLDVLSYLHQKNLVHGGLKPPNILVVNDQLKLASDTIRHAGQSAASMAEQSVYAPPEAKDGKISSAGDIWALGVTMVEALTQTAPTSLDERSGSASLPASLPPEFAGIVRRCLSRNPAGRPILAELEAEFKTPSPGPAVPAAAAAVQATKVPAAPASKPAPAPPVAAARAPVSRWIPAAAGLLVVALAFYAATRLLHGPAKGQSPSPPPSSPTSSPTSSSTAVVATAPEPAASAATAAPPSVLHQEIPDVSRGARATIHGDIKVGVRVNVDGSGNVIGATLLNTDPSKYFLRLSVDAARKWKFSPADNQNGRQWSLQFEFTREATTAHAVPSP
jgi:TonB family protein